MVDEHNPAMTEYVVTLVHGSFAHGAGWIKDDAPLPMGLRKVAHGRLLTFPFEWSGKNTHAARVAAARDLAKCLRDRAAQYPVARHSIIAHSHGGNVALYAARIAGMVDLKIVTLGTPFIRAYRRDLEPAAKMLFIGGFSLLALGLCAGVFIGAMRLLGSGDLDSGVAGLIIFGLFAGLWLLPLALLSLFTLVVKKMLPRVTDRIEERQEWLSKELTATCTLRHKLLVASVTGDEAMRALSVVDILAETPYGLLGLLAEISAAVGRLGEYLEKAMPVVRPAANLTPVLGVPLAIMALIPAIVPIACMVLAVPLLLFGIVRRFGYWDDKLTDYALARIAVSIRPQTALQQRSARQHKEIVYNSDSVLRALLLQRLLQHSSLYQRNDIATEIGAWLVHDEWPSRAYALAVDDEAT